VIGLAVAFGVASLACFRIVPWWAPVVPLLLPDPVVVVLALVATSWLAIHELRAVSRL